MHFVLNKVGTEHYIKKQEQYLRMSATHDESKFVAVIVFLLQFFQAERCFEVTPQIFQLLGESVKVELDEVIKMLLALVV